MARKKSASSAYKEGNTYSARLRRSGQDVYVSGFRTKTQASQAAEDELAERLEHGEVWGMGPRATTLAQGLQAYGLACLGELKGAAQESRRINKYLRAAGLAVLVVRPVVDPQTPNVHFKVSLKEEVGERKVPNGLHRHRRNLLAKTADSDAHRDALATTEMQDIKRFQVQAFVRAMTGEGVKGATVGLERALLRRLFNYARTTWNWHSLRDNPAASLKMPKIDNERTRILSQDEQERLSVALRDCRNPQVAPAVVLLLETAMRSSEPLEHARWRDVNWEGHFITLSDSKSGGRKVPLSPEAIQALQDLKPGEPDAPIVSMTYEALRAAFNRACERAGIEGLNLHDLRHTGATRLGLKTGNIFLVMGLTGHKTLTSAMRYMNTPVQDVLEALRAPVVIAEPSAKSVTISKEQLEQLQAQAAVGRAALSAAGLMQPTQVEGVVSSAAAGVPSEGVGPFAATAGRNNVVPLRRAA